ITHPAMTRFWITLPQAAEFVLGCFGRMKGAELFVPKIPSMRIVDLAKAIGPKCEHDIVGIRPGEKLHEVMVSEDDAHNTVEFEAHYVIRPTYSPDWLSPLGKSGKPVPEGFRYSSDTNTRWLTTQQLSDMVQTLG